LDAFRKKLYRISNLWAISPRQALTGANRRKALLFTGPKGRLAVSDHVVVAKKRGRGRKGAWAKYRGWRTPGRADLQAKGRAEGRDAAGNNASHAVGGKGDDLSPRERKFHPPAKIGALLLRNQVYGPKKTHPGIKEMRRQCENENPERWWGAKTDMSAPLRARWRRPPVGSVKTPEGRSNPLFKSPAAQGSQGRLLQSEARKDNSFFAHRTRTSRLAAVP
jgi:hypothetical protein